MRTTDTSDVTINLDGALLPRGDWASVPVDPGRHKIEATAPLKKPWSAILDAPKAGTKTEIVVPALEAVRGETKIVTVTRESSNGRRTLGYALGGFGIAGIAAATITGIVLLDAKSTAEERCPERSCVRPDGTVDAEGADAVSLGKTLLPINVVAWAVGVVGLGAGAFFVLTSGKKTESKVSFVPLISPMGGTLGAQGTF